MPPTNYEYLCLASVEELIEVAVWHYGRSNLTVEEAIRLGAKIALPDGYTHIAQAWPRDHFIDDQRNFGASLKEAEQNWREHKARAAEKARQRATKEVKNNHG
jgi:hypothetical protein